MNQPDRPWMVALEMQFAALRHASTFMTRFKIAKDRGAVPTGSTQGQMGDRLVWMLRHAEAYAWSRESVTAVYLASKTIPRNLLWPSLHLSGPAGWWWFDHSIDTRLIDDVSAVAYHIDADGLLVLTPFGLIDEHQSVPGALTTLAWPPDEPLETMIAREAKVPRSFAGVDAAGQIVESPKRCIDMGDIGRLFAAGCLWVHQRIVTTASGHIERHRRKQLAREYDAVVSDVKVVQLRRAESQPHQSPQEAEPVEWSCRWIVNGHWRNQYHPSSGKHELQYILPYVKGPAEKPLKVPTHTVYSVSR